MKTKNLLLVVGAGYIVYRGIMAGGGQGGPIGVVVAGLSSITASPGRKVVVVANPATMCGGKPCLGA